MDTKLPGLPDPFFSLPVSQPDRLRRVAHKLFNAARAPEKDLDGLR